jgi:Fumarylacetoacetase N-terminal
MAETGSPAASWVPRADGSGFGVEHLPYGVIRGPNSNPRPAVRIGDQALAPALLAEAGLLDAVNAATAPDGDPEAAELRPDRGVSRSCPVGASQLSRDLAAPPRIPCKAAPGRSACGCRFSRETERIFERRSFLFEENPAVKGVSVLR